MIDIKHKEKGVREWERKGRKRNTDNKWKEKKDRKRSRDKRTDVH